MRRWGSSRDGLPGLEWPVCSRTPKPAAWRARCLVALGGLLAACGGGGGGNTGPARSRDSAGITIVENADPGANPTVWAVPDGLEADIGGNDTTVVYDLNQVTGAVRLSDGRLVVANGSTSDIRYYDADGRHLLTTGRRGQGPGEFQQPVGLWVYPGDSVLVFDAQLLRLTVLDPQGRHGRTFGLNQRTGLEAPSDGRMSVAFPVGTFSDGSLLGQQMAFNFARSREGAYQDTTLFVRFSSDGSALDTLGSFPGLEMRTFPLDVGGRSLPVPAPVPLGRNTLVAPVGDHLLVASNDGYEIQVRGGSGTLLRLIRMAVAPRATTEADIAAHREEMREQIADNPMLRQVPEAIATQMQEVITQGEYPATLPLLLELRGDGAGNIWAQEMVAPASDLRRFAVFDAEGAFQGKVTLPEGLRPTWVDATHVIGVWIAPDGLQHVRSYRYRRGG